MTERNPSSDPYCKPRRLMPWAESSDPSPLAEALQALHLAPGAQRDAFWTALRDSLDVESDPAEPDRARMQRLRAARPAVSPTIYYVRFSDRVKIGFTTNLAQRLKGIPHDELLATEPGTTQDEKARHAQFAALRVKGEWFRYEEPLRSHISSIA